MHHFVCTVTGAEVFQRCRITQRGAPILLTCPLEHVISIHSAEAGFIRNWSPNGDGGKCGHVQSPCLFSIKTFEVVCNERQVCTFNVNRGSCFSSNNRNVIKITYNCFKGRQKYCKIIFVTFCHAGYLIDTLNFQSVTNGVVYEGRRHSF